VEAATAGLKLRTKRSDLDAKGWALVFDFCKNGLNLASGSFPMLEKHNSMEQTLTTWEFATILSMDETPDLDPSQ
jgi:hypothetical protein